MDSTTETRRAREEAGHHPFYVGLYRLFRKNGYVVYTNDTYTSGVVETPSGWVDHWIRYARVKGREMTFAYDAPEKVPPYIQRMLLKHIQRRLDNG